MEKVANPVENTNALKRLKIYTSHNKIKVVFNEQN